MRTSMAPAKSRAVTTIRFSTSGMPRAPAMALVAVDHQGVDQKPDRGEKHRHRREEGDGPPREELLLLAPTLGHVAILANPAMGAQWSQRRIRKSCQAGRSI